MGTDTNRDARPVLDLLSREMNIGTSTAASPRTDLTKGALGLTGATMQAITHTAPTIAVLLFTAVVVDFAGVAGLPAYVVGVVIRGDAGQLAGAALQAHAFRRGLLHVREPRHSSPRRLSHPLDVRVLLAVRGWFDLFYGFFGFIVAGELRANYSVNLPWLWWACIVVGVPIVAFLQAGNPDLCAGDARAGRPRDGDRIRADDLGVLRPWPRRYGVRRVLIRATPWDCRGASVILAFGFLNSALCGVRGDRQRRYQDVVRDGAQRLLPPGTGQGRPDLQDAGQRNPRTARSLAGRRDRGRDCVRSRRVVLFR